MPLGEWRFWQMKWRCCQKMAQMAKNRQRAGDIHNVANIQIGCQKWPLGEWRFWQNWRNWQRFAKDAVKPVISKSGNLTGL